MEVKRVHKCGIISENHLYSVDFSLADQIFMTRRKKRNRLWASQCVCNSPFVQKGATGVLNSDFLSKKQIVVLYHKLQATNVIPCWNNEAAFELNKKLNRQFYLLHLLPIKHQFLFKWHIFTAILAQIKQVVEPVPFLKRWGDTACACPE